MNKERSMAGKMAESSDQLLPEKAPPSRIADGHWSMT